MVEILVVWATWRLDNGSNGEHPTGWFYRAAFDPNWREEGDAVRSSAPNQKGAEDRHQWIWSRDGLVVSIMLSVTSKSVRDQQRQKTTIPTSTLVPNIEASLSKAERPIHVNIQSPVHRQSQCLQFSRRICVSSMKRS
mmetsp:Transcript_28475/g.59351  ORF Transcript_28475/g.59351 Transcript_28475/m.59351 type:complete len:138 (+) Transcript_28475:452-865(+)